MMSYLEKSNLHHFTISQNYEKPFKAAVPHLSPDTPGEGISNSLEDLGFNIINLGQMTATRRTPSRQTHMESLTLFLVTLTRSIQSEEIFKLNGLNRIIIKVELFRAKTGLMQCYNCQTLAMFRPNASTPLDIHGAVVATCTENALKSRIQSMRRVQGEKPHLASYRACSHARGELQKRGAKRAPKGSSGKTLFSKFTSPEQTDAAALRQDVQHQQPQARQTDVKNLRPPVQ
jgi:hypothetical protein